MVTQLLGIFIFWCCGFAPWSIICRWRSHACHNFGSDRWRSSPFYLGLFALFWFVFLVSSPLPSPNYSYVLPLMPAAILVALLFSAEVFKTSKNAAKNSKLLLVSGWLNVVFLLVVAIFCLPT